MLYLHRNYFRRGQAFFRDTRQTALSLRAYERSHVPAYDTSLTVK